MAQDASEKLLDKLTRDFKRLQRQKARKNGGVEGRVLTNLGFVFDEHYIHFAGGALRTEVRDANKLYLMFNLITPRMMKLLGRLSSMNPTFQASPSRQDPKAYATAEVVDRLIQALDDKLVQPSKTWEILWWMAVGGTSFEYVPWIPNSTTEATPQFSETNELLYMDSASGMPLPESQMNMMIESGMAQPDTFDIYEEVEEVGEVGSEVLGPFNVFIDQGVHSVADLSPDQRVYVAKIRTAGWIKNTFDVDVEPTQNLHIVTSQFVANEDAPMGYFLKDLIPAIQGSHEDDDPDMAIVVESYLPASRQNPHGRYECFIPGQQVLHADTNPYEEIPLVDFHWKPVTTTFWTPGYIEALIPPQRFLNKRLSQLGEQANATVYANLLLGPGLTAGDIPADHPGPIEGGLDESGTPRVQRMAPPELPAWYMPSIEASIRLFNDISGGSDLFEEQKFPGQMRGPLAVPMMQEILDTEWGPLYQHIGERLAAIKQMRLNRVKQFYPPMRTMHYTDRNQKDEVLTFHTDKVMRGGLSFNVRVKRGELIPELRSLREARIKDRLASPLAILYVDERTGMIDKSKVAADLKFGDAGRDSREGKYRKLAQEINDMLWEGQVAIPPVLPFYDHQVMLDELEAEMSTMEYLRSSPLIQAAFVERYEQHRMFLIQEAQAQQQAMASGLIHNAVAQATQQAAAMAASDAVTSTRDQNQAQGNQPTERFVSQANGQGEQRQQERQGGSNPRAKKRKLTISREESD